MMNAKRQRRRTVSRKHTVIKLVRESDTIERKENIEEGKEDNYSKADEKRRSFFLSRYCPVRSDRRTDGRMIILMFVANKNVHAIRSVSTKTGAQRNE